MKPRYKKNDLARVKALYDASIGIFQILNGPRKLTSKYEIRLVYSNADIATSEYWKNIQRYTVLRFDEQTEPFNGDINTLRLLYG